MVTHIDIEQRYAPELRGFCRRMVYQESLAEDIVQELMATVCRCYQQPATGNGAGPPLGVPLESPRLRGWLYRLARNRCIDELRKMRPEVRLSAIRSDNRNQAGGPLHDPLTTPSGKVIKAERIAQTQAALDELDDDLRSVVIMRVYQELSRQEMAEALGLSVSGVKDRLSRAFRCLQASLSALNDSHL